MSLIENAVDFAERLHEGQTYGIHQYSYHLTQVYQMAKDFGYPEQFLCIAVLHDTLEDTDTNIEELASLFGSFIATTVECLTHRKNESYEDYIRRICHNSDAKAIKTFDVLCNFKESVLTNNQRLIRKYEKALYLLVTLYPLSS